MKEREFPCWSLKFHDFLHLGLMFPGKHSMENLKGLWRLLERRLPKKLKRRCVKNQVGINSPSYPSK
jgi:hypothetical protein